MNVISGLKVGARSVVGAEGLENQKAEPTRLGVHRKIEVFLFPG
jgi:hypothetical protein